MAQVAQAKGSQTGAKCMTPCLLPFAPVRVVMSATESSDTPPFRLSALLSGHSDDVRALSADESSSTLFSSSRDGTARVWERRGPKEGRTGGWEEKRVFSAFHTGFVNAVAWLPKANAAADDPGEKNLA